MPEYDALLQACLQHFFWGVIERANNCMSHIVLVQVLRRRHRRIATAAAVRCLVRCKMSARDAKPLSPSGPLWEEGDHTRK
jgi:hypothetical protein